MLNKVALITIIQNGNEFFKIWYKYYSKIFAEKDIYIIDYCSTDGSTDGIKCNIIKNSESQIENVPQGNKLINDLKRELLKTYTYVIYADYDEILYHPKGLQYLLDLKERFYTTQGYEIVQDTTKEPALDFQKSILEQRKYWYRCTEYDKPLITSIDFKWSQGNHSAVLEMPVIKHGVVDGYQNVVLQPHHIENLYLLHLHKVDYTHCLKLNEKNVRERSNPTIGGNHNFLVGENFKKWWAQFERNLVLIPESISKSGII